ncbi:hypothetical protein H072_7918 [Dactylellina haptotyla CBS 200.50]|uniref:Uncharacterized protein n=1 Tax=Dactylellina haptotyla (strain CBS 200.50) TaxID=1284197 RepID=S8A5C6_DACHA|nr:hypothetical protein H072_7918 [Dactylellina haptotyla CBS 200.50]
MPKSRQPYNYTYKPSYQTTDRPPSGPVSRSSAATTASGPNSSSSSSVTAAAFISSAAVAEPADTGVNALLAHLRLTQGPAIDIRDERQDVSRAGLAALASAPTVHPSLRAILGVNESLPPQPRARGFIVPNSWRGRNGFDPYRRLQDGESTTSSASGFEARGSSTYPNFEVGSAFDLEDIAGFEPGAPLSLVNTCLRSVARNWQFHLVYDKYFLRELRPTHKSLLLAHLAAYTLSRRQQYVAEEEVLAGSINKTGFEILFRAPFPADKYDTADEASAAEIDSTLTIGGTEYVSHLNFAGSIGYSISLRELSRLFCRKISAKPGADASSSKAAGKQPVPDSWEDFADDDDAANIATSPFSPDIKIRHFPNLTHLSLAYPKSSAVSFSDLLKLAKDGIPTITHLSLANWPTPISGASSLSVEVRVSTNLRHLSQSLICLRYLDVSDCDSDMYRGLQDGVDWAECWKKVDEVVARQGQALSAHGVRLLSRRNVAIIDLEQAVRGYRRAARAEMCRFVYSQNDPSEI